MTTRRRAKATASARAEPKRPTPKRARRTYTAEDRRAAVERVEAVGLAATHRETGIPRRTLSDWTRAAGVDLGQKARERTAKASAAVEAAAAEAKVTTASRLEAILDDQLATYAALSRLERRAAELTEARADDPGAVSVTLGTRAGDLILSATDPALGQALGLIELLTGATSKRDVVGAVGQAVDKLALLRGDATVRGEVILRFGIPRPSPRESDANAVDEADLGSILPRQTGDDGGQPATRTTSARRRR